LVVTITIDVLWWTAISAIHKSLEVISSKDRLEL